MNNEFNSTSVTPDETVSGSSELLSNDEVISKLNGLIETNKNGQEGFANAAGNVKNSGLESLFTEYSQQRAQFAAELGSLVSSLGGDPENSGTFAGALHRGWIDIKAAFTGGDEAAILNECERGEDVAKDTYRETLKNVIPEHVADVIRAQYQSILEAHQKIKGLRDSANNISNTANA